MGESLTVLIFLHFKSDSVDENDCPSYRFALRHFLSGYFGSSLISSRYLEGPIVVQVVLSGSSASSITLHKETSEDFNCESQKIGFQSFWPRQIRSGWYSSANSECLPSVGSALSFN